MVWHADTGRTHSLEHWLACISMVLCACRNICIHQWMHYCSGGSELRLSGIVTWSVNTSGFFFLFVFFFDIQTFGQFLIWCCCRTQWRNLHLGSAAWLSGAIFRVFFIVPLLEGSAASSSSDFPSLFQVLASASGPSGLSNSQICLWDLKAMTRTKTLSYHEHDVVCLAYSRDDRFLVSMGEWDSAVCHRFFCCACMSSSIAY